MMPATAPIRALSPKDSSDIRSTSIPTIWAASLFMEQARMAFAHHRAAKKKDRQIMIMQATPIIQRLCTESVAVDILI